MKKLMIVTCASLLAFATTGTAVGQTYTMCPVNFAGTGASDEYIAMFCAEFEYREPHPVAGDYMYFDLVSRYPWASRLHNDKFIDTSTPPRQEQ